MTEARGAHEPAARCCVGKRPMTRVGRAVEKGETQGFMKVVVDAETQKILGAAILGTGGDEAIHGILDMMTAKAPYDDAAARRAHPPDGVGADPDRARGGRPRRPLSGARRHTLRPHPPKGDAFQASRRETVSPLSRRNGGATSSSGLRSASTA